MVGVIPCILQMRKQAQIGDMIESRGHRGAERGTGSTGTSPSPEFFQVPGAARGRVSSALVSLVEGI